MIEDMKEVVSISSFQIGKNDYLLANGTFTMIVAKSKDKQLTILHAF